MSKTKAHFEIEKAQSVIRTRILEIRATGDDKLTDALRTERDTLDKRYAEGEIAFRASLDALQIEQAASVTAIDAAGTELRALTKRSNLGGVFSAAMAGRPTDGAEAELQAHHKLASNQIPIEMLRLESRAASTVPASIGDATQAEVILPVFASGDGAFLGIERPTVEVGVASFPMLSTRPTVHGPFSNSSDAGQTDGTFVANALAPERLQASYSYRASDAARFAGLDSSLRLALNLGLQEKLDQQAINGGSGLLNGTNLAKQFRDGIDIVRAICRQAALWQSRWQIRARTWRRENTRRLACVQPYERPLQELRERRDRLRAAGRTVGRAGCQSARSGARKQKAECAHAARYVVGRCGPTALERGFDSGRSVFEKRARRGSRDRNHVGELRHHGQFEVSQAAGANLCVTVSAKQTANRLRVSSCSRVAERAGALLIRGVPVHFEGRESWTKLDVQSRSKTEPRGSRR